MVAGIAVPLGLLVGTILAKFVFLGMFQLYENENIMMQTIQELMKRGDIQLIVPWIFLLAIGATMLTVFSHCFVP